MSDELKQYPDITWIKKGSAVPAETKTKTFTQEKILNRDEEEGETDFTTWFRSNLEGQLYEEVIGLGAYGRALTVLSCSDLPDLEELAEDEELEESWTPRFKR